MASLNTPEQKSEVRHPRATLKLAGKEEPGLVSFTADQNTNYQANTLRAVVAINAEDGQLQWPDWATVAKGEDAILEAEISVGEQGEETPLFVGIIDEFDLDPAKGVVSLRGRDKTSLLMEKKTTEKYAEMYGFAVVEELAKEAGITDLRVTKDKTLPVVGTYLDGLHASHTTNRSYWDYLTWVAQTENYLLYFDGQTLVYEPDPAGAGAKESTADVFHLEFNRADPVRPWSNAESVILRRSLTVSRDILVEVRSMSLWEGNVRAQARSALGKRPQTRSAGTDAAQVFTIFTENLDREQAQKLAETRARQITSRQVQLTATLPGTAKISPKTKVVVQGTGTDFDQDFYVDHLIRTYEAQRGYSLQLKAKNHATATTVAP